MRTLLARASMLALIAGTAFAQPVQQEQPVHPGVVDPAPQPGPGDVAELVASDAPRVQLAILLDTSGSMDGLIEQAKAQLWTIVNELATTKRNGKQPQLEVALYEYGKSSLSYDEGYIRMILPLTRDLDAVSAELFALTTNGGDEYCGWVIQSAARSLKWSPDSNDLKMIVIAGNEPFDQGTIDFRASVPEAIGKGIIVNTIHCGSREEGISSGWEEGARLADGTYTFIDQTAEVVQIPAPQDEELVRLNAEINQTYLPYGEDGFAGQARQWAADEAALQAPAGGGASNLAERCATKGTSLYSNVTWDLVDAVREQKIDLATIDTQHLPEAMRTMSVDERCAYVESYSAKRAAIMARIQALSAERDAYIAQVRTQMIEAEAPTLGDALRSAVREQAERCGFEIDAK